MRLMDKRIKLAVLAVVETGFPPDEAMEPEPQAVTGRGTLQRARYFLRQAAMCGTENVDGAEHNLNAAIVFGRSVTLHIQSQYGHRPDFDYWYAWQENAMRSDPLLSLFVEARNVILKEGPVRASPITKTSNIVGRLPLGWIDLPPQRYEPWHRRGVKGLVVAVWGAVTLPLARVRLKLVLFREVRRARRLPETVRTHELYFVGSQYGDRRASDLVREYLEKLERVVQAAEVEIAADPKETGFPHLPRPPKRGRQRGL